MRFKKGDIVKTLVATDHTGYPLFDKGTVGVVSDIDTEDDPPYEVTVGKTSFWYEDEELEPYIQEDTAEQVWEMIRQLHSYSIKQLRECFSSLSNVRDKDVYNYIVSTYSYTRAKYYLDKYEEERSVKVGEVVKLKSNNSLEIWVTRVDTGLGEEGEEVTYSGIDVSKAYGTPYMHIKAKNCIPTGKSYDFNEVVRVVKEKKDKFQF